MLNISKYYIFLVCICFVSVISPTTIVAHELQEIVTVTMDESGFTPKAIRIEPHTTVVFKNVGEAVHWPASDSHPTHSHYSNTTMDTHCATNYKYQTFDACRGIAPGESWSFTFEKAGNHTYHDHLRSHLGGNIFVHEIQAEEVSFWKQTIQRVIQSLYTFFSVKRTAHQPIELIESPQLDKDVYDRIRGELVLTVSTLSASTAIQQLINLSNTDESIAAQCHDLLHEIGKEAYLVYGDFSEAIKHQTDYCNSGYIHGLFEAYFESKNDEALGIDTLCDSYAASGRQFDSWQCYHGVGHGFMYQHGGNLTKALDSCGQLASYEMTNYCNNGVFMELFNNEVLAEESSFINYKNPLLSCEETSVGKSDCLFYVSSYLTQNMDYTHKETIEQCNQLPLKESYACLRGAGAEAAKRNQNDLSEVIRLCDLAGSLGKKEACLSGIIGITVNQTASVDQALIVCTEMPMHYQPTCVATAESYRPMFQTQ